MRTGPALVGALVLLALAGCTSSTPHIPASPSASATPVFASDADALAAAEAAYAAYLKVSDEILIDGGKDPKRILTVATESVYENDLTGYQDFQSKGWRSTGGSKADGFQLESYSPSSRSSMVVIYLCSDVSAVDVFDGSGISVVAASRPARSPLEVTFDSRKSSPNLLAVSAESTWTGSGIC